MPGYSTKTAKSTALLSASSANHEALAQLLVAHGADVTVHNDSGRTALHYAAIHKMEGLYEALLLAGASIEVQDAYGNTPGKLRAG